MRETPLTRLVQCGQSIWLDYVSRPMFLSGGLISLIQEDGVSGVATNPAVFERAVAGGEYDQAIAALAQQGLTPGEIHESLVSDDARVIADLLHPLYERVDGRDGYVSVGLSPHLAHDSAGTLIEARRLWELVNRPNLMITVPATWEGVAAVRQLVREGINVNVTLIFGVARYRAVAEAYLDGLSERAARGLPLARVASVASLFLSRIDNAVDPVLARIAQGEGIKGIGASSLKGEAAIACAKVCRLVNREIHSDDRYLALAAHGARQQRLLWASMCAWDSTCGELKYPEALIGPGTVTSMTLETLYAYRDYGHPESRLDDSPQDAVAILGLLAGLGIDLDRVAGQLEDEGVERFARPYDSLMRNIELKRVAAIGSSGALLGEQEGKRK